MPRVANAGHFIVLGAVPRPRALYPLCERRAQRAREIRVLRIVLKVPAAQRIALDIQSGAEQHVHAVMAALLADRRSHFARVLLVPAAGERRRGGKRRSGFALPHAVVPLFHLFPKPVRPVRHADGRDAEPRDRIGVHEVRARHERDLLLRRQLPQNAFQVKPLFAFSVHLHFLAFYVFSEIIFTLLCMLISTFCLHSARSHSSLTRWTYSSGT